MENEIRKVALFIFMSVQKLNLRKCNSRKRSMRLIAFQERRNFFGTNILVIKINPRQQD